MPRTKSYSRDELISRAMQQFWCGGFDATSMDDLVRTTGVSRHGIYSEFGDKQTLFDVCLQHYSEQVVTSAFARLEQPGANLDDVAAYFAHQLTKAEQTGLPGPGCLMVNTLSELASCGNQAQALVQAHNQRLTDGFANAISHSSQHPLQNNELDALARSVMIYVNGLWSVSRSITSAAPLRQAVSIFLQTLQMRITA